MALEVKQLIQVAPGFRAKRGPVKCDSHLGYKKLATAIFDTAGLDSAGVSNKTIAAHGLGVYLPIGAIITLAYYQVKTTFTSATNAATIALSAQSAGDLKVGIAISDASNVWNAANGGLLPGNPAEGTVAGDTGILAAARMAATFIGLTAEREITATVAVEALTAGKAVLFIEYVQGL
jgi:hypothetical protein